MDLKILKALSNRVFDNLQQAFSRYDLGVKLKKMIKEHVFFLKRIRIRQEMDFIIFFNFVKRRIRQEIDLKIPKALSNRF